MELAIHFNYLFLMPIGEVSEWPIVQAWKVCVLYRTGGSNPPLSAKTTKAWFRKAELGFFAQAHVETQLRGVSKGRRRKKAHWLKRSAIQQAFVVLKQPPRGSRSNPFSPSEKEW